MNKETISQIKARLQTITDTTDPYLQTIRDDSRKGVQTAIQQFERRLARQKEAEEAFNNRFKYEKYYWEKGCQYVAGMDEVGRGPLAGPVVTCVVILNADFDLIGVTDSKQLTRHERENLYLRIVDAVPLAIDIPQTTLIKGDQKSISVAAASIVAKEYRDHLMRDYDYVYRGYGFAQNMGYGTKEHLAGLEKMGATPIHRRSFNPVPKYLN